MSCSMDVRTGLARICCIVDFMHPGPNSRFLKLVLLLEVRSDVRTSGSRSPNRSGEISGGVFSRQYRERDLALSSHTVDRTSSRS